MAWFNDWWAGLSFLQQCFGIVAVPATVILILQTILLLVGLGGHSADHGEADDFDTDSDADVDTDGDIDADGAMDEIGDIDGDGDIDADDVAAFHDLAHDHDYDFLHEQSGAHHDGAHHAAGLRLFTLRGIVALFAVGGWLGIAMCDLDVHPALCVTIAAVGGIGALVLSALVIKYSLALQESGNISAKNAVAHTATVYIPIPPSRTGTGKVTMTLQERFVEMDALTDENETIPTGKSVQVVSITDKNELVVRTLVSINGEN